MEASGPSGSAGQAKAGAASRREVPVTVFDDWWKEGVWGTEHSGLEARKFERMLEMLSGRRYDAVLEIGCGDGGFTRLLPEIAGGVVALDVSGEAIRRARRRAPAGVDFRVENVMDCDLEADGPWDLVIMSETIPYVGWIYSFFDVAWLASQIFTATADDGRFLLANLHRGVDDWLYRPWVIHTYRDLFQNVGYRLEAETTVGGCEEGGELEFLLSLYTKPSA